METLALLEQRSKRISQPAGVSHHTAQLEHGEAAPRPLRRERAGEVVVQTVSGPIVRRLRIACPGGGFAPRPRAALRPKPRSSTPSAVSASGRAGRTASAEPGG